MRTQNNQDFVPAEPLSPLGEDEFEDVVDVSSPGQAGEHQAESGMLPQVKNLYLSRPDMHGRASWVDRFPNETDTSDEEAETDHFALVVRKRPSRHDQGPLQVSSIKIQSPLLKDSLGRILQGYPGINTNMRILIFNAPFAPLLHRWNKLVEDLASETNEESKTHLNLLHGVLATDFKERRIFQDFVLNGVIVFDHLWVIFEPGAVVLTSQLGDRQAAQLVEGRYEENDLGRALVLSCRMIDWDGEAFGFRCWDITIGEWEGTKKITELSVIPLVHYPDGEKLKESLVRRGKAFEALSGYHFKHYRGTANEREDKEYFEVKVDSSVIIDAYGWNRFKPFQAVLLRSLNGDTWNRGDLISRSDGQGEDDAGSDGDVSGSKSAFKVATPSKIDEKESLTDEQLLICSAWVRGYSINNKRWLEFSVENVRGREDRHWASSNLVLPRAKKDLIFSVAESHIRGMNSFDDFVPGKGKGLIMLLSGPRGVGKTLTAEAIADEMDVPLYTMGDGDSRTNRQRLGGSLSDLLEMTVRWNAVLLLDEADVFLGARIYPDGEPNDLVCRLLNMLEYHQGLVIMTTTEPENISPAIKSRVGLSIQYPELDQPSRKNLWKNFIMSNGRATTTTGTGAPKDVSSFTEEEFDRWASRKMNGREIKHAVQMAQMYGGKKTGKLAACHVDSVLDLDRRHSLK